MVIVKIAFIHDFELIEDKSSGLKYNEAFNFELWKRYLNYCDELHVVSRIKKKESKDINTNDKNLSTGENVFFHELPDFNNITLLSKIRRDFEKILSNVDCIILRIPSIFSLIIIDIVYKSKKPYLLEVVGDAFDAFWNHGSTSGKMIAPYINYKTKQIVYNAQDILYVTEEYLQRKYPSKAKNITSCSDVLLPNLEDFIIQKRIERIENHSNLEFPQVGLIGSMNTIYKGIDIIIDALGHLEKRGVFLDLRILGQGTLKPFYEELAKKKLRKSNVYFDGTLSSGEEVYKWLDKLDIYVQPSLTEGLPRALIEAISRGIPAIGSNVGGIPELLDKECIFKNKNSKDLAIRLEKILHDPIQMKVLAENNFNRAKNYTKTISNLKRDSFWNEFLKKSNIG